MLNNGARFYMVMTYGRPLRPLLSETHQPPDNTNQGRKPLKHGLVGDSSDLTYNNDG